MALSLHKRVSDFSSVTTAPPPSDLLVDIVGFNQAGDFFHIKSLKSAF